MDAIIRFLQDTGFYLFSQDGNWRCLIMLGIACVLLYLGIVKKFEPLLLVPIAFGMLITNLPGANMFHEIFFAGGHIHWDLIGGQPVTASLLADLHSQGVAENVLAPYIQQLMTAAQTAFSPEMVEQAIKSTRKYGGEVEATMSYTVSPIHNEDYFVELAKTLEEMGASAICVKDMANLLLPMDAYSLIKRLKETVSIPIHLHTHNTTGTGDMVNLMAAMAGVDIVDTALSPLANGTSQPATESLVATLRGTVRDTGLDQSKLSDAAAHFRKVAARLQNEGILDPKVLRVDTNTLLYQVPGGMLSNLISQLKQAGKEDKYYDVLAEIPRVRKDFGYPPLVTPTSQIVGTQAVMNVIVGKYKTFPKESKGLLRGEYGALPGQVNPEVRALAGIDPEEVITCRPADNIAPELETYKEQFKDIAKSEEDVLSLALFPQVAPKFLAWRDGPHEAPAQPAEAPKAPPADPNAVRELFVEYKF